MKDDRVRAFMAQQGVPGAVARVRTHLRRRAVIAAALWGAAALGVLLTVAWLLAGPAGWRQGSPGPLLLDVVLVALAALLVWSLERGDRRWLTEARVARAMEDSAGLASGAVQGALQLARDVPSGASGSLAAIAEHAVAIRLALPSERLAGSLGAWSGGWVRRGGIAFALLAIVVVLLGVASPARSRDAWAGLGRPLRTLTRATLAPLVVSPGDAEVLRGSSVSVSVLAPGRTGVTLEWQAEGDVRRSETITIVNDEAHFRFSAVGSAIEYTALAPDGAASPSYRIVPVDPLLVSDVEVELVFPPHTGRAAEAYEGALPPLVVPTGTRIAISGRATRPLREALLEREHDGLRVPLLTEGSSFATDWTPRGSGRYAWRFQDASGADAELVPDPLDMTVVPDSAPSIRFAFPAADTVLPLTLEQPLVIELRDDYGVDALELVAYRVTSAGQRLPPVVQRSELGGTRAALARPIMDLSDWGLLPGDTVRYFARALDNAPSPSASQTREYALRMPQVSELRRDAQEELEDMADRLERLAERARRAGEDTRDLEREAGARNEPARPEAGARPGGRDQSLADFEQREQLRQALEQQRGMAEEARQARAELEAIAEALREAGASDPQLQEDLRELQRLLEEVASPELAEQLEEMAEDLASTDSRNAQRTLEELVAEQERFREQLESSLERLRRAAVEQDFRATAADARELGQREQALADALSEGGEPELRAEQQAELGEDANALAERLERLAERLAALEEHAALAGVEQAGRGTEEAARAMERAQRALQDQLDADQSAEALARPNTRAAQQARRAGATMERAADQLEQARQAMSSERAAALQRALEQAGQDALALARRQSAIRRQMQRARGDALAELRGDEAALLQGLRTLAESILIQTGGPAPQLRDVMAQLGEAMAAVESTVEALGARRGVRVGPEGTAEEAVEALNGLAIAAMAAGQSAGEGDDPGQGDVGQQLEDLAQQQGQLNNRASQIVPLQLGQQAMGQQLGQLSQGQQQVARELEELAQQPGAEAEALGSLEALAEEARQLAKQLAGGRLDPETRARQERLFHRLLDAGRMLENDELSDDRQSRAPAAFERGEVLLLGPGALGVLRYGLPSAEQLQRLSPAERDLVLRYFDRLNQAPPTSPVPGETPAPATTRDVGARE